MLVLNRRHVELPDCFMAKNVAFSLHHCLNLTIAGSAFDPEVAVGIPVVVDPLTDFDSTQPAYIWRERVRGGAGAGGEGWGRGDIGDCRPEGGESGSRKQAYMMLWGPLLDPPLDSGGLLSEEERDSAAAAVSQSAGELRPLALAEQSKKADQTTLVPKKATTADLDSLRKVMWIGIT
ncbi:MAG: hypothetical protein FRX49_11906 [Trebouxia sp. A1-2]|nr:MAG: hypothetical protein FRX49_11906 [Trebouxia sp. A1-2]